MIKQTSSVEKSSNLERQSLFKKNEKNDNPDDKVYLNRSLKKDVVDFANNLSKSVLTVKDSSKYLLFKMDKFDDVEEDFDSEGLEDADRESTYDELNNFAKSLNRSSDFLENQQQSQGIVNFSGKISELMGENADSLGKLGITKSSEDGKVTFDESVVQNLNSVDLISAVKNIKPMVKEIYNDSKHILESPLSNHMNFKGLTYYYNYKYPSIKQDTFKLIESGLVVDVLL